MFGRGAALFLYAETPFHPGSGASTGVTDLPVQRERTTAYPVMAGSGVKGALRAWFESVHSVRGSPGDGDRPASTSRGQALVNAIFGPPPASDHDYAGSLVPGELRVLLFPVRAVYDTFAWITCPHVLNRLCRDLRLAGLEPPWPAFPPVQADRCRLGRACPAAEPERRGTQGGRTVVLEEYSFQEAEGADPEAVDRVAAWLAEHAIPEADAYWGQKLFHPERGSNLVVLSDRDFRDFVETATETVTRIRVDPQRGTAAQGALWTEERIPSETLLYTVLTPTQPRAREVFQRPEEVIEAIATTLSTPGADLIHMGGDETVGCGFLRARLFRP